MTIIMEFLELNKKNCKIILINQEVVDDFLCEKILLSYKKNEKLGLDMKNVKCVKGFSFVKNLLENNFKLFNLKDELLVYLSIALKNGSLKSYLNKNDFLENKRELIKRSFLIA